VKRLPLYKSKGIVLLRKEVGEGDKSVIIYTSRFGKIETQAKGARRIKSRFSGIIEPFSFLEISFWWGEHTSIIREAKIIKSFSSLREDTEKMEQAAFITKAINGLVGLYHPDDKIFKLLLDGLLWIEEKPGFLIKPLFIFKLISILGLFPDFSKCMCCGKEKWLAAGVSLNKGGLICNEHLNGSLPISLPAIKIIDGLSRLPFSSGKRITIPENFKKEIASISQDLLSFHLP